jgi:hypothetical protein
MDFPMGAEVTFADASATTSTEEVGVAKGTVNGPSIHDPETGKVTHVPVWAERDNGREPTTVFVAIDNILNPAADEHCG